MKRLSAIFFLSAFSLVASRALAVGIIATPSQLSVDAKVGEEATAQIHIKNPSDKAAIFRAEPDSLNRMVRAFPSLFTLEGAEERDITVRVAPESAGTFHSVLSLSARPLAGDFQVGSGIKIPLTINAKRSDKLFATILFSAPYLPWTLLIVVCAVFISLEARRRMRKIS